MAGRQVSRGAISGDVGKVEGVVFIIGRRGMGERMELLGMGKREGGEIKEIVR
jgi:hypothetical protein